LYYWKKENLEIGVHMEVILNYVVKITDMERSVCDAVKYRNKIGLDVCSEVIRNYLKKPSRNLTRLMEYAKQLRVANVLKNYLEIVIEQ
jgi:predicted CopG family antitoxin